MSGDEDEDDAQLGEIAWECFDEHWIGLNIRDVCGTPLDKDDSWKSSDDEEEDHDSESMSDGEYNSPMHTGSSPRTPPPLQSWPEENKVS